MKALSTTPIYKTIRREHSVFAVPQLIAEWNYNRFAPPTVDNTPTEEDSGQDLDVFPIESIVEPLRPSQGIVKARVGEARVSESYQDNPEANRYYVASPNDVYKYWCSPVPSDAAIPYNFALHTDGLTMVKPAVTYDRVVSVNKLVLTIEKTWSAPDSYEIFIKTTTAGIWQSIGTNFPIDSKGRVTLYYNGTAWTTTENRTSQKDLAGIQLRVYSMNKPDSFFNLIEISARLERDLSQYLVTNSDTFEMSDRSFITPLGQASANQGSIELFNEVVDPLDNSKGLLFNNDNLNSPYYKMVDSNIKFTLGYMYDTTAQGGTATDYVQAFEMYGDLPSGQTNDSISVALNDYAVYLQTIKPPKLLYQRLSVAEIIWRLCDSVGFSNYAVENRDDDPSTRVSFFWTDGIQTVWEVISELAQAYQAAVYFDSMGVLQIKTRRAAYNESQPIDWTLRAVPSGTDLPDIIDYSQTEQYEANQVTVNYQTTAISNWNRAAPKMAVVWEPEGTVTLRAAPLRRSIEIVDTWIWLDAKDIKIWPYEGIMNIEGELIRYKGKKFVYYEAGIRKNVTVYNEGEKIKFNRLTPDTKRHNNGFTGAVVVEERGLWNSEVRRHTIEAEGYSVRNVRNGTPRSNVDGMRHNKRESTVTLHTPKSKYSANDVLVATRGAFTDSGFFYYGTKMMFEKDTGRDQKAGIVIHNNGNKEGGYYIEIRPTKFFDGKTRQNYNELSFFSREVNGTMKRYGGEQISMKDASKGNKTEKEKTVVNTGVATFIAEGRWFELDVSFSVSDNGNHKVNIWIDGILKLTATVPQGSGWQHNNGGKFGMFVRGNTKVSFEYLYAISRPEKALPDDISFLNRVRGGYMGESFVKEWTFKIRERRRRRRRSKIERSRFSQIFMDEFGPIVHEVREFDVTFEPMPVVHSRLYKSNDEVFCTEYSADSFGSNFVLANAARRNVVVSGEDSMAFEDTSNAVNHVLVALGRVVTQEDAKQVVVKAEAAIRRRGLNETEFTNRWIQNEDDAKALGEWINSHWSEGNDEVQVTIFGNPLIEIGDLVNMEHPEKSLTVATHKYFVVGSSTNFSGGLETSLTLRRCKI